MEKNTKRLFQTSHISSLLPSQPQNASLGSPNPPTKVPKTTMKHPKTRFLGVRQRPSGRWVAEIKDSSLKLRLWLGTFDRPEEAALAYDSAARLLRGRNARTNFSGREQATVNTMRLQANPRFHQLLSHANMKQLLRSSLNNPWKNRANKEVQPVNFDAVVEETIVCTSEDGIGCLGCAEQHDESNNNKICGVSVGSSKVYSSVVVAPSFSKAP